MSERLSPNPKRERGVDLTEGSLYSIFEAAYGLRWTKPALPPNSLPLILSARYTGQVRDGSYSPIFNSISDALVRMASFKPDQVNARSASSVSFVSARNKRLKRFGFAAGIFILGLIMLRAVWGFAAYRRLNTQVERYRSGGQFVNVHEFDAELNAVAESENAAVLLEKAMDEIEFTTDSGVYFSSFLDDPVNFETNMPAARELMQKNTPVLVLVRQARRLPKVAWSSRLGAPTGGRSTSQQRLLSKLLWFAITYDFRTGDHVSAISTLQDDLAFDNAVAAHPSEISNLVTWALDELTFSLIENHGVELHISEVTSEPEDNVKPASREQVEQLIRDLLSEATARQNVIRACQGDRASTLYALESNKLLDLLPPQSVGLLGASPCKQVVNFMAHPILVLDTARELSYETTASEALAEDDWPRAAAHFRPKLVNTSLLYRLTRPITYTSFGSSYDSTQLFEQAFFRALAKRRMAAIAIAIRLYAVDHGERPQELAALVPKYLPRLLMDPFAAGGVGFGYKPLAERPLLYSVGYDGRDNDGKVVFLPNGYRDSEKSDHCFYLEPERPVERATGAALSPKTDEKHEDVK